MYDQRSVRTIMCGFIFLLLFCLPMTGAAQDLELLDPGVLQAATEGTFPPFSTVDDKGDLTGLEIVVTREICRRLGLEYKPVMVKWESILVGLFADKYDITTASMDITEARQKQVVFVNGWLESGGVMIVPQDTDVKGLSDLKKKKVGCLVASTYGDAAEALGATSIKYYKSVSDGFQDLVNGGIDILVEDSVGAAYAIQKAGLPLKIIGEKLTEAQKGFAVKKGKPNLVKAMNKALADMVSDGTYARLTKEIIGIDPSPKKPVLSILP